MARSTMSDLITTVRGMTNAGSTDYTIAGASYWTDDQIQTVLDRHRVEVRDEPLRSFAVTVSGGSVAWYDYQSSYNFFEQTGSGGSALFVVQDSIGTIQGTALWTADYSRGLVTFGNTTGGTAYYLTARSYDVNGAAAEIWRQKAAAYAVMPDFSTDNHSVKRSHIVAQCERMATYYDGQSTGWQNQSSPTMARSDSQ